MNIHNLTRKEKKEQRKIYYRTDFPYSFSFSLGEYPCNRSCRMCPMYNNPVTPENSRYISDKVVERACAAVGDRMVSFEISAYGETFVHPKADEYLVYTRKHCPKATIVVATNGTLLDDERCEKIVDSGIDHLSFSLDAGSPESYKWLTGSDDYRDVCDNLERLVAVRDRRNAKHLRITTHIIGIKELAHEFDSFVKRWAPLVDTASVRNYGNWAGIVDNNGITPAEEQRIPSKRYPCAWLWYATKIEPDGAVSKCFIHITGERNPLGNILEEDFIDIWQGQKLARARELHRCGTQEDLDYCKNCIVWSLFPNFWNKSFLSRFGIKQSWR